MPQDHERHRVIGVDYPGLVPRPGKSVRGTLVENLTLQDIIRLDAFEGEVYFRKHFGTLLTEGIRKKRCSREYHR